MLNKGEYAGHQQFLFFFYNFYYPSKQIPCYDSKFLSANAFNLDKS